MKQENMNRRSFLRLAGLAGAAAGLPLVSPALGLASLGKSLKAAQETRMMMGTLVAVTVVDESATRAQEALAAAFQRMAGLRPIFDRHASDGLVNALNREGRLTDTPPMLAKVLDLASWAHRETGGAFDASVAPLVDAIETGCRNGGKPGEEDLNQAMKMVGSWSWDGREARLTAAGAAITLDGVAKGFMVDEGLAAISATGVSHALINAGGDIGVLGDRGGRPWRVAVSDPSEPTKPLVTLEMTGGAVATSGNYEVYFDREKLFHHIVSPRTGKSPRAEASASVRASSAALADAMSTACFVMGPVQARQFLNARPGLEGMMITRSGLKYTSSGFLG